MKNIIVVMISAVLLFSCGETSEKITAEVTEAVKVENKVSFYGSKFDPKGAISPAELLVKMEDGVEKEVILKTTINGTCAKKGCWMSVDMPNNTDMMISMIDYSFFVPKSDAEGLETYIKGRVIQDTVSVAELQHYAEDANKSKEEIEAITEPEYGLSIVASGIAIVGYEAAPEEGHEGHDHDSHEGHSH